MSLGTSATSAVVPGRAGDGGDADRGRAASRWLWRQRIRLHLEGTGINPTPVDLHEQQLSLTQHSQAHRIGTLGLQPRRELAAASRRWPPLAAASRR